MTNQDFDTQDEAQAFIDANKNDAQSAECLIQWRDSSDDSYLECVTVSFSTYNPITGTDEFGGIDDGIFFYTGNYEAFKELVKNKGEDFIILQYSYDILPDYTFFTEEGKVSNEQE